MGGVAEHITLTTAYRQLRPTEKAFVDTFVADLETEANRRGERISAILSRGIPAAVVDQSRGMLEKPMVRAAITERVNELASATELLPQRIVKEWLTIGFNSMANYFEIGPDGHPYFDLGKCKPEDLAGIASIEIEEGLRSRKIKFKLYDKLSALEKLAKVAGLLEADNAFYRQYAAQAPANDQSRALPGSVDASKAADLYSQMINGG